MKDYQNLIEKYKNSNPYQNFDISKYNDTEQRNIENLIKDYMNNIEEVGWLDASNQVESIISSMSNIELQQSMYNLVSQIKFTQYYLDEIIEPIIMKVQHGWSERFWKCMHAKADAQFGEGSNVVDWVQFMIAPPVNFAWWVGSCSWTATFKK